MSAFFSFSTFWVKRRLQCGDLGVHRLELGLVGLGELGAGAHEILVVALEQPVRLGVQAEFGALVVERLDAREERAVQVNRVLWAESFGAISVSTFCSCGIRCWRRRDSRKSVHPPKQIAGFLQRDDRVLEGRGLGVEAMGSISFNCSAMPFS